ncbi:uncharacterized protein LOC101235343 isoform X1 [Hydra vulgaris]|uniref:uncharacterized protein LOC101235343 isoform X1 n=1 Tax=Hydra vulgaris TaxID=6087 RepID=UPI001F5F5670|nr:uncharacterized protein LOC101235343 isoform X1 [Hydra vulgaris]
MGTTNPKILVPLLQSKLLIIPYLTSAITTYRKHYKGVLQHQSGRCVIAAAPKELNYQIEPNLPRGKVALLILTKNCKNADIWSISDKFIFKNERYNLTANNHVDPRKDRPGIPVILTSGYHDHDFTHSTFLYSYDNKIYHRETGFCVKLQVSESPEHERRIVKLKGTLVFSETCSGSQGEKFFFKDRSKFQTEVNGITEKIQEGTDKAMKLLTYNLPEKSYGKISDEL